MEYDIIIIGGGPSGLALAQCISHLNKKILIIEKENNIGGCHRVRRINELFTEHGPRVYSNTYTVFQSLLKEMDLNFTDLFTPYNFSITQIGNETVFSTLSWHELYILFIEFIKLMINNTHGINIILKDFIYLNNFKPDSVEMIDRVCKLTDGGGIDKYTLNQFLQLFNQQFFYSLYQPKTPTDKGLFPLWKTHLESKGVTFYLNTEIENIYIENNQINNLIIKNNNTFKNIKGNKYIFAIPPKNLYDITFKYNIPHNWGNLLKYANDTAYIEYISVSFHWNEKLNLEKIYGFPKSTWGVAFIILSDYMTFQDSNSQTVISTAVTITDKKSLNNNKTANECNQEELINEILLQLREAYPNLPNPTVSLISPGVTYNNDIKQWVSKDTAFIMTSNKGYLPFQNGLINNMYNLGTHNGKSYYKFTSLESAVSNSVMLSKELYNELKHPKYITLSRVTSVSDIFNILIIVLIIYLIYLSNNNGK